MAFGKQKIDSGVFNTQLNARLERLSDGNVIVQIKGTLWRFFCTKCNDTHPVPAELFANAETILDEETSWAEAHTHPTNNSQPEISLMQAGAINPVAEQPISVELGDRKLKVVI